MNWFNNYFRILNKLLQKWLDQILAHPLIRKISRWAKSSSLPGFQGVSVYQALYFVYLESQKDDIVVRAKAMAHSFFLALFPAIIFLLTLIPYLPFTLDYMDFWKSSIQGLLPVEAEKYLFQIMDSLGQKIRVGSQFLSLILMLYFTSNGISTLLSGFAKSYEETFRRRNFFQHKLVALEITFLLIVLLLLSTSLIIMGNVVLDLMFREWDMGQLWRIMVDVLRWIVVVVLLYITISILFRYGPAMKKKMRFLSPGAGIATFLSLLSSVGFSYFVNNFGRYNEIYGSLGAIIILMIWMEFNSLAILAGYELNAAIAINRDLNKVISEMEEEE
jgi:membrane protein